MAGLLVCPRCGEKALPEEFRTVNGQCMVCTYNDRIRDVMARRHPDRCRAELLEVARRHRREVLKDDD